MKITELTIGTVISYNDIVNVNREVVILNTEENRFGIFVKVLVKETNIIELKSENTIIDGKTWKIVEPNA